MRAIVRCPVLSSVAIAGVAGLLVLLCPSPHAAEVAESVLARVVADRELWGEDGLAAIAAIAHWQRLGENIIVVYPDRVVSGTAFAKAEDAAKAATALAAEMARPLPAPRQRAGEAAGAAAATAHEASARASSFQVEVIPFLEDGSVRPGWKREGGVFLKREANITSVFARYGKPEKTTTEVVHAQGERRPAILTIHEYAEGAVKFVESDLSPTPGTVDRVYLDTRAVARELYGS